MMSNAVIMEKIQSCLPGILKRSAMVDQCIWNYDVLWSNWKIQSGSVYWKQIYWAEAIIMLTAHSRWDK